MKCKHEWKIFRDGSLVKSGFLSFYCMRCLALKKVKKEYEE